MNGRARLALCALLPLLSTGCLLNPISEDPSFDESQPSAASTSADGEVFPTSGPAAPMAGASAPGPFGPENPAAEDPGMIIDGPGVGPNGEPVIPPAATGTSSPTPSPAPTAAPVPVPTMEPAPVTTGPVDTPIEPSAGDAGADAGAGSVAATASALPSDAGAEPVPLDAAVDAR